MKIAQVAPLIESVPPKLYGGTERIVSYLTEGLVDEGHEVTLFASGDSITRARLISTTPQALRLSRSCKDPLSHHVSLLDEVYRNAGDFDFIHFHVDYLHFLSSRNLNVPQVTTLHGRLDIPDLALLYERFSDMPVVSISNAQRGPLPFIGWQGTVYHGLPVDLYSPHYSPSDYLAFLGRISEEKGVERAIEISRRSGRKLKIAAKVDAVDRTYYYEKIEPLIRANPTVEFIGEIDDVRKNEFLGNAYALLFPINWPEPFGVVMIEAMACGTPVIAYSNGSVPEVMEDGLTGYIVDNIDRALSAVERVPYLSRRMCRKIFEKRFTNRRMAQDYLKIYQKLIREATPQLELMAIN